MAHAIMNFFTAHKELIATIAFGFVAGLIAQLVTPGKGFGLVLTTVIGIGSCFLSRMFLVKEITFVESPLLRELIGGVAIAVGISLIINLVLGRDHKKEK